MENQNRKRLRRVLCVPSFPEKIKASARVLCVVCVIISGRYKLKWIIQNLVRFNLYQVKLDTLSTQGTRSFPLFSVKAALCSKSRFFNPQEGCKGRAKCFRFYRSQQIYCLPRAGSTSPAPTALDAIRARGSSEIWPGKELLRVRVRLTAASGLHLERNSSSHVRSQRLPSSLARTLASASGEAR
jgi:hypothetical protein